MDKIKIENPDLPDMMMHTYKKNGGDKYLKNLTIDPKPAQELSKYKSEGKFLLDYLNAND